jgi:hypothetical protein
VVIESADGVRRRVRELVDEAARRLDVQVNDPGTLEWSGPPLPAALDEFLSLIGSTRSDLSRAWFPSGLVGRELLVEGHEHSKRTLEIAGLPEDLLVDVAFFLSEPSGSVAWVEMAAGDDPPVQYIHEASTETTVWTETFTEWLSRVIPSEDGKLAPWT